MSKTQLLFDNFDGASKQWGWEEDMGTVDSICVSFRSYQDSKKSLLDRIADLEKSTRIPLVPTEEMIRAALMCGNESYATYEDFASDHELVIDELRRITIDDYKAMVSVV